MRKNHIDMLDHVGVPRWLGLRSTAELFGVTAHLVQWTSVLRNPVFHGGTNYNGTPSMVRNEFLRRQLVEGFGNDSRHFKQAIFVPLGGKVAEGLKFLVSQGVIEDRQILGQLPHPSHASAERVAYFLGCKKRSLLSIKSDPDKLDLARSGLQSRVAELIAA